MCVPPDLHGTRFFASGNLWAHGNGTVREAYFGDMVLGPVNQSRTDTAMDITTAMQLATAIRTGPVAMIGSQIRPRI